MPQLAPYIFDLLYRKGVEHAFGIPGDFALTLYDALAASPIRPVVMTHEPCVGFAADAYSRVRGLGLAVVTYSVGGLNMVNSVAGAYAEKSPLIIMSGSPGVRERQERDLLHHKVKTFDTQRRVYEEVTACAITLDNPAVAIVEIHRAIDYAMTFKRPVYLEIPRDMVFADIPEAEHRPAPIKKTDPAALAEALDEAAELIRQASSPVVMACVESHRFGLQQELVTLVEALGVPVCSTMSGKSVFPEGHRQYIGVYNGEAGDPEVRRVVEESDCLLMLGVFLSDVNLGMFTAHLDPARAIYATSETIAIKHHQYGNVLFQDFVRGLCDRTDLPRHESGGIKPMTPRVSRDDGPISMSGLLFELNASIDGDTLLVTDVGDAMFAADDIRTQTGTSYLCPAFYASMGFAVPGVIGAHLADTSKRAIALVGDGAFQITGMELLTAGRLGLAPTIILMNNGSYASLRAMGHQNAEFVSIPRLDYAEFGRVLGGSGRVIRTGPELRSALQERPDRFRILDVRLAPDDCSPALTRMGALFAGTLKG